MRKRFPDAVRNGRDSAATQNLYQQCLKQPANDTVISESPTGCPNRIIKPVPKGPELRTSSLLRLASSIATAPPMLRPKTKISLLLTVPFSKRKSNAASASVYTPSSVGDPSLYPYLRIEIDAQARNLMNDSPEYAGLRCLPGY